MNELYAEAGVKKANTTKVLILRILLVIVAAIALILSFSNTIMAILSTILIIAVIYLFPRMNVEYEYIYCDGQLDFDRIIANSKRKTALRIDFEQVEFMAPKGSHALDSYNNNVTKVKDFSSGRSEAKPHVIIYRQGEERIKILFEPNEKMIQCIKMKNPRKISEY